MLQKYQIVHCHDVLPILLWTPPFRLILPSRPVFATYHGYERDPVPARFRCLRKGSEHLIRGPIGIGSFIERVYGTHCNVFPLGGLRTSGKRATDKNHAIYVGRLESDTPIVSYIDAIKQVRNRENVDLMFTACGEGSLKEELEAYCNDRKIPAEFVGNISNPTQYYLNADVALAGGFLSILEAMSYELPVIAYSGTSLKQQYYKSVLTAGGPISIQSTAAGVAREIERLRGSRSLYNQLSERVVEFAEKNNWNQIVDLYPKLWSGSI
jgi:glycosyltransferase involved in cell wall biosynthesis